MLLTLTDVTILWENFGKKRKNIIIVIMQLPYSFSLVSREKTKCAAYP